MTKRWRNVRGTITLYDWSIQWSDGAFVFTSADGTELKCLAGIAGLFGPALKDEQLEIEIEFMSSGCYSPETRRDPQDCHEDREAVSATIIAAKSRIALAKYLVRQVAEHFETQINELELDYSAA